MSITNATYTSPDWTGYKYPLSLAPLPNWMSVGLGVLCGFSFLSTLTCVALLCYLTNLFVVGGAGNRAAHKNQYVILIYNLLIADLQLAVGFLVSIKWLHDDQMLAPSSACVAQAWLTNVGDLASGLFVLAIAAHTSLAVILGRSLEFPTFCSIVVGLWIVSVAVTAIPVILHPVDIFVVAGNWCSINSKYDILRLYCHYVWVFLAEFLVLFLYGMTFIVFRHRIGRILPRFWSAKTGSTSRSNGVSNQSNIANNRDARTERRLSLAAMYMILYPIFYVIVTLPLAAGRIASLAGNKPSPIYLLVGGSFMTSAGWIDCLLYSLTRRAFLTRAQPADAGMYQGRRSLTSGGPNKGDGTIELSTHVKLSSSRYKETPSPSDSTDHIMHDVENTGIALSSEGIKTETSWEVLSEDIENERDANTTRHKTAISTK